MFYPKEYRNVVLVEYMKISGPMNIMDPLLKKYVAGFG